MISFLLQCIYFYFPAALANVGAVIGKYIPFFKDLNTPIDFGYTLRGHRLIGPHKLWGNFLFGILFGTFWGIVKTLVLDPFVPNLLVFDLTLFQSTFLYFLMSIGAPGGDLLKSLAKRQLGIAPHLPWIPFDEIDHTVTSLVLAHLFFPIPIEIIITTIVLFFFLHIIANLIGFFLKIKSVPY